MRKLPLILLILSASLAWAFDAALWDDNAKTRKAEYLFLESENAYEMGEYDRYAALIQRAYELDSADLDIAYGWGTMMMATFPQDSLVNVKAYKYAKDRFYSAPDNYLTGLVVASIARRQRDYKELVKIWETLDSTHPELNQPLDELANAYLVAYIMGDSAGYQKALNIFDRMEIGSGKSIDISNKKIQAFSVKQDSSAVIDEIMALSEFAPNDPQIALFVGANYQVMDQPDKALEYFDKACRLDSTDGNAFLARAQVYHEIGDSVAFDQAVFQALHSPNLEVESKLEILRSYVAELYSDSTQEPRIRELFTQLEAMHSGEPDIHNLYGAYLFEIKDYTGAADEMTYSVALDPENENAWTTLLQMLAQEKDVKRMLDYGLDARKRFPDNYYFPICIAEAYKETNEVQKAIDAVEDVALGQNNRAEASFLAYKGDTYAWAGDTIKALETYDQAIDLYPDNLMALNNAAYFMACNGKDLDKAEKYISRVINQESDNPTYMDTYAWVFFKKKDYNMAKQYIDITLNLFKGSNVKDEEMEVEVGENNSQIQAEAIEIVQEDNIEEEGISADVYEHAGDIYFMCGEPDKALDFWIQALALDPENELLCRKVKHKTYFYK